MESREDYIARRILKLYRRYGKDEFVKYLTLQVKEKDVLIGQLKSEIDHLNNELKKIVKKEKKEFAKTDPFYKAIQDENKRLRELNKGLKLDNERLIIKLNKE